MRWFPSSLTLSFSYTVDGQKRLLIAGDMGELWSLSDGAQPKELPAPVYELSTYLTRDGKKRPGHMRIMSTVFDCDFPAQP